MGRDLQAPDLVMRREAATANRYGEPSQSRHDPAAWMASAERFEDRRATVPTQNGHPGRPSGFMLVELVVALVIVALAFGYGFRSLSGAMDRLGRDHTASSALLLAQSTLDRVGYDIALDQDQTSGTTKDGFTWTVQTAPYRVGPEVPANLLVGYVVRVSVAWTERRNVRRVQLSTVRLAYRGQG